MFWLKDAVSTSLDSHIRISELTGGYNLIRSIDAGPGKTIIFLNL